MPPGFGPVINWATANGTDKLGENVTDEDFCAVAGVPPSLVTDTSYCYFDRDEETEGQQFRLIFTKNPLDPGTYKLTASNPGQFYYNVFYLGIEGYEVNLDITIPYPFVTQGAQPIHVYSNLSYNECGGFIPKDELSGFTITGPSETPSGAPAIELDDYGEDGFVTITVEGTVQESGLVYVTIHLDYGLKGTGGYQKGDNDDANNEDPEYDIPNYGDYEFSVSGDMEDTQVIQNMNRFKHNPGFGGLVTDEFGDPIEGYTVRVFDSESNEIGNATTDEDGFYIIYYKHKGKGEIFTVKLYDDPDPEADPVQEKEVYLKANKFVEVNFVI
jgi:hypothetical protein